MRNFVDLRSRPELSTFWVGASFCLNLKAKIFMNINTKSWQQNPILDKGKCIQYSEKQPRGPNQRSLLSIKKKKPVKPFQPNQVIPDSVWPK
jgi:hypothetical protein